jgi:hypothetical protein
MEKNNYLTEKFRLIHLILILLGLFGSGVAAWIWQKAETKAIGKEITITKKNGCTPAKKHESQIGIIMYRLDSIDKGMCELSTEQKETRKKSEESFKEILKRLPK